MPRVTPLPIHRGVAPHHILQQLLGRSTKHASHPTRLWSEPGEAQALIHQPRWATTIWPLPRRYRSGGRWYEKDHALSYRYQVPGYVHPSFQRPCLVSMANRVSNTPPPSRHREKTFPSHKSALGAHTEVRKDFLHTSLSSVLIHSSAHSLQLL